MTRIFTVFIAYFCTFKPTIYHTLKRKRGNFRTKLESLIHTLTTTTTTTAAPPVKRNLIPKEGSEESKVSKLIRRYLDCGKRTKKRRKGALLLTKNRRLGRLLSLLLTFADSRVVETLRKGRRFVCGRKRDRRTGNAGDVQV